MGIFADWAPIYADAGVRVFPVNIDEEGTRPTVRGYLKAGDNTRRAWADATKFADTDALGIDLRRSGITVLDIDEPNEKLLADAMDWHGQSSFIVRSQGGNFQAYYRNNGEPRDTTKRRWPGHRIDLLGGGMTVAAPSQGHKGNYEIIVGDLEDLSDLPKLRNLPDPINDDGVEEPRDRTITTGRRNHALFTYTMRAAHNCESEPDLLAKARQYAIETFDPALPDSEVQRTVASAWGYTVRGENYASQPHTRLLNDEINTLAFDQPDAYILLSILRCNHWGRDEFLIADAMANKVVPFNVKRLRAARRYLKQHGYVVEERRPSSKYGAGLFSWPA
ncbi:hypothetical protein SAOR_01000 [Salinisphaera orenii MK-B5]|uniref:DNA primase/polymerase bifunctional N-terminal domain-containing protein n=1 Tax=Salinisphaera orenii MK-B5 TaxID=856730 RepID=A0A423PYI9_9GAMM|nr:bifunctional DNA primase/polymerase [Salinisphaera orenii]ROO30600.1 hypothetical protein SAOR_01000 [Salinisphaera orenii MK-B5]